MNINVPATLSKQVPLLIAFVGAYLEAVEFTDFGEDDQPAKGSVFADSAVYRAFNDCSDFMSNNIDLINQAIEEHPGYTIAQAGHDFWMTRRDLGAGFWNRGLSNDAVGHKGNIGDALTAAAESFSSLYVYEDTGEVFFEF